MLGQHGQGRRRRIAPFEQQVDDDRMHLAPSRDRGLVHGELADLLVDEREVGGLVLRLREEQAGPDGGSEIVGQRVGTVARRGIGRRGLGP